MENLTTIDDEIIEAIAKHFEIEIDEIEDGQHDHCDLETLDFDGMTYALAESYDEAERAAADRICDDFEELPTMFSAWVLTDNCANEISLSSMEELISNGLEEVIKELVDVDGLVDDCISSDSLGNFLAPYDNEEIEIDVGKDKIYLYRID